ncbi:MAG: glycosyltransferase family 4 protein [Chloroflexi bacterium]|nr:glycosyltransferase family 4 protein [Chloroflexota bacterium]
MHILLVSNYPPPYEGGIQFVMERLCEQYLAAGHRVTILASDTGLQPETTRTPGQRIIGVPASNVLEQYSIPFPLFDPLALLAVLGDMLPSVDVVHVHGLLYMNTVLAAWLGHVSGKRVVLTEHVGLVAYDSAPLNTAQRVAFATLGRVCCRSSDAVVVLNQRVADEIRSLPRRRTPLVKIPNGVDTALFHPPTPDRRADLRAKWGFGKLTVLFVGRLVQKKGIDLVVAAARLDSNFDVVICGKDTERLAEAPPNVRVIGLVDQPTLAELYQAADVLLLPSEGEGFPLVVQEALASGLPVIVSDDAVYREYLDETVAVFTERDPGAILAAIQSLLASDQQRRRMGETARAWAVERFDWAQTAQRYLDVYRKE